MGMRSNLGQVRGLGSAKSGTHHWWMQRMTAVAMLLLGLFLVASLAQGVANSHIVFTAWLAQPWVAVLMALFVINLFYHIRLGLQVLIEDYVHDHGNKYAAIIALTFFCITGAALGVFAILKIAL
jgi:succinate dehydrogenase / fumarate reductase, membrane anchor subunit